MKKLLTIILLVCVFACSVACKQPSTPNDDNPPTTEAEQPIESRFAITFNQKGQLTVVYYEGEEISLPLITVQAPEGYSYEWERTDFTNLNKDITVNAILVANTYVIHYDVGADSYAQIESKTQSVTFGSDCFLYVPTRYGYSFKGWKKSDTDEQFVCQKYNIANDLYLVAVWQVDISSDRWFTPDL